MKKLFLILFLFWTQIPLQASPTDSLQTDLFVYSLEEQWLVYDKTLKTYLPYFNTLYDDVNKLHINIGKSDYQNLYFNIQGDSAATIFINQRLAYIFSKKQWISWSIDSLKQNKSDNLLLLTYYTQKSFSKIPEGYITVKPYLASKKATSTNVLAQRQQSRKQETAQKDIIIIIAGIVLTIVAVICSVHTPLFKWSLLWKNFANFIQARTQIKRLQGLQFLWYTIYYSLTLAFIIMLVSNKVTDFIAENVSFSTSSLLLKNVFNFFVLFIILVISVLFKYLIIAVMGNLYYNRQSLNLHLQEYITISQIVCSLILLVGLIVAGLPPHWQNSIAFLKYATLLFLALQTALIGYRLRQSLPYTVFYFLAYLFSTEFLPFILYSKLFMAL